MSENGQTADKSLGDVVGDVSTKASLLIREEIELAKTEIAEKAKSLAKGSAVAAVAGVEAVFGILIAIAGLAGFMGFRWIKKGAPPTPDLAIEEAKRTRAEILEHN